MSDIDVLVELEAMLPDLPAALDARRLGGELTKATAALRNVDRQIDRIEALLDLAALIGFGGEGPQRAFIDDVRDAAYEAGEGMEEAETASALEKAVAYYERELNNSLNTLDRSLGQHWRSVSARQFEPMIAIGNLLSRIDPDSDLGRQLAACGQAARSTLEGMGGRTLLDRVSQLARERDRLQARRKSDLGEGEVAEFVNALADNRANLSMISETVRRWLEENHAMDKLKVMPA